MKNLVVILILFLSAMPSHSSAQGDATSEFEYNIHINYPSISLTRASLDSAETILDLNKYYKPSWVKEYVSVETRAYINGTRKSVISQNDELSQEQKDLMNQADVGTDIAVMIKYIPDNNLSQNDIQTFDFTFTLNPDNNAHFIGGQAQLEQYLKEKAIDKLPEDLFTGYKLAAVKFTVSTQGEIIDAHNFWTSEDDTIDALLYETICTMPKWKPASYTDNTTVDQDFVLTVGNMQSCVVNMLNIDPHRPASE